jgi:L-lysine exporter family protein LysE/ArgO
MITSLISGLLLGLGAALPLGPINLLIINSALKSYKSAVAIGFGAMCADIIYFILTFYTSLKVNQNSTLFKAIAIFGSLFLLYIAWQIFKNRNTPIKINKQKNNKEELLKNYTKGLSLTLLNPYTVGFWLSISATIASKNLNSIATIVGIVFAISLWITLMPLFINKSKHLFSQKLAYIFSLFSASIMLYFAVSLFLNTISS